MKIIKRSGMEDTFDIKKIEAAIRKANESVIDYEKLTEEKIQEILANVEKACENMNRSAQCGRDSGFGGKPDHEPACFLRGDVTISPIAISGPWSGSPTLRMSRS